MPDVWRRTAFRPLPLRIVSIAMLKGSNTLQCIRRPYPTHILGLERGQKFVRCALRSKKSSTLYAKISVSASKTNIAVGFVRHVLNIPSKDFEPRIRPWCPACGGRRARKIIRKRPQNTKLYLLCCNFVVQCMTPFDPEMPGAANTALPAGSTTLSEAGSTLPEASSILPAAEPTLPAARASNVLRIQ